MTDSDKSVLLTVVPCAPGKRGACDLLREALERLLEGRPELQVLEADSTALTGKQAILALDSSRECRASEALKARRIKPLGCFYLPDVIASRGLLDSRQPLAAQRPRLVEGLTAALTEEIERLLVLKREEAAYFEELRPVVERYRKEAKIVEEAGPPSEEKPVPPEARKERLALAANRFRNLFMRCDEITPPAARATTHDIFQDACMCMTYALQHWERGEWQKSLEFLEQAGHQAGPLLRHKGIVHS